MQEEQEPEEPEEDEEDEVERHMVAKSSKAQGKRRQVEEEPDEDMEEEIAQGLDEVDNIPDEQMDQDDEPEEPQRGATRQREQNNSVDSQPRPSKKARIENENTGPKRPRGRPRKDQQVLREGGSSRPCSVIRSLSPVQLFGTRTLTTTVVCAGVTGCAISLWNGGAARRLYTADVSLVSVLSQTSRRLGGCRRRRSDLSANSDGSEDHAARVRARLSSLSWILLSIPKKGGMTRRNPRASSSSILQAKKSRNVSRNILSE